MSVVIPVYNAEKFVERAVNSALSQPEVCEVLLIEDHSPDNALAVCRKLAESNPRVKLFRHPNEENRGAGASRNLGVSKASGEFIAFLDADDTYCPSRFKITQAMFAADPELTGVYEAVGVQFEDEVGKKQFSEMTNRSIDAVSHHVTMLKVSDHSKIYSHLIRGDRGFFNTSGVTIRRSAFTEEFFFNENLRLHQDTELWIRLSFHYKFVAGSAVPVSLRGVHRDNRIVRQNLSSRYLYYNVLLSEFRTKKVPYEIKLYLFRAIVRNNPKRRFVKSGGRAAKFWELLKITMLEITKFPLG